MKNTKKTAGLSVKTAFKAGGLIPNHNRGLKTSHLSVKTALRAGGLIPNHNRALIG